MQKRVEKRRRQKRGEKLMKKSTTAAGTAVLLALSLTGCSLPFSEYSIPQTQIETTGGIPERVEPVLKEQTAGQRKEGRLTSAEDASVFVELGKYKDLVLETPQVDDAQVEEEIRNRLAKDSSNMRQSAKVQEGDTVLINYVGTINYRTFDGSIANNYSLRIGSGEMAEGFEAALIGMRIGQTREFQIPLPEDYYQPELAGVTADYRVTLQSFSRPASLTEEWVQEQGAQSIDEYRETVRQELTDAMTLTDDALRAEAWEQVIHACRMLDYPPEDIETAKEQYRALTLKYAQQGDMELDAFLASQGLTPDRFEEQQTAYARQKVMQNLVLQAIMDSEGLSLTDEASGQVLDRLAESAGVKNAQALEELYGKEFLDESVALERVLDFIIEHRSRPADEQAG